MLLQGGANGFAHTIVLSRRGPVRVATIHDEEWIDGEPIADPEALVRSLRDDPPADIFTFARSLPECDPCYSFHFEWDNVAVANLANGFSSWWEALPQETRNAVRLLGGAAVPAHFPPYVGAPAYRELTNKRMAAILRNSRRARRYFAAVLADLTEELGYTHGLYLTLSGKDAFDEAGARRAAADMSEELGHAGLPIRHAGSFGFDFAATEWFRDATTLRYSVRIAVPDLPTELWNDLTEAIARWWSKHQRKSVA